MLFYLIESVAKSRKTLYTRDQLSVEFERGQPVRTVLLKKNTIFRSEKAAVYAFLKWQCIVAVVLIAGAVIFFGGHVARSVLFGCLVTIVPNIALAVFIFMRAVKRTDKQLMRACYVGELLKLVIITIMMVLILCFFKVQLGAFLVGFLGTYVLYWMAPIILKKS